MFLEDKWLSSTLLLFFCYLVVAFVAAFQIGRIVYYKHKKFSYQSAFLLLCFSWAVLRAIYFLVVTPSNQDAVWLAFIYWTPINIQFATFTLLVAYYASLVHPKWKERDWKIALTLYIVSNVIFLIAVAVFLFWSVVDDAKEESQAEFLVAYTQGFSGATFFVLVIVLGSYALLVFFKIRSSKISRPFHIQGSPFHIVICTFIIVIIYISRSAYDIITIFGYLRLDWTDDVAKNMIIFALYCLWELTPVIIVLVLFRRIPKTRLGVLEGRHKLTDSEGAVVADAPFWSEPRSLFDNEKRYDSGDEDVSESSSVMPSAASPRYGTPGSHMPYSTTPVYSTSADAESQINSS
eukprot:TRINITY_DN18426_c0_g1_i1.p1 TRINITY_DN18426_c0_g1~~TRINITY_DN18426_c0_g1_i1.p1  ORF type:complete len:350 (+),score=40.85 TRINITY_DN18426_c0_g1_i1:250-1299(+)